MTDILKKSESTLVDTTVELRGSLTRIKFDINELMCIFCARPSIADNFKQDYGYRAGQQKNTKLRKRYYF